MPARAAKLVPPYTIEEAVDDERAFWKHIGGLIDTAVEKALRKHGVPDAVEAMRAQTRTFRQLIERNNEVAETQKVMAVQIDKLVSWCTLIGSDNDEMKAGLKKILEAVSARAPAPTPPAPPDPTPPM